MGDDFPPPSRKSSAFLDRLARFQLKRPGIVLLVSLVLSVISILFAMRLEIRTGFANLLPENRPSVVELRRVAKKTAGVSTIMIVLEAPNADPPPTEALRKAADALVPELEKIGSPYVGSAESGVHDAMAFLQPRAGLFGDLDKLTKVRDQIEERYKYEVDKNAYDLGLDDEDEDEDADAPPPIDVDKLKQDFGLSDADQERYPDGYYQSKDGRTVVVTVRAKVLGSDFNEGSEALRRVKEVVARVDPASFNPDIAVGYSGDLVTALTEYKQINDDLTDVGLLGALLITSIVLLYYLRFRTLLTMLLTISVGVSWSFGMTELMIGHLNMATGFLFTIIAGNGINPGIIYMARYLETRRRGASLSEAIRVAHRETWLPTLTASAAASAAFASLLVTEFRGFRDFGAIGGVGMLLCWIATFWTLPAILVVVERIAPIKSDIDEGTGLFARFKRFTHEGLAFGRPFAALVRRAPKTVFGLGTVLGIGGIVAMVAYIQSDPMEYNLKNLRSDMSARAEVERLTDLADGITGHVGSDGMAILVDKPEQVAQLTEKLLVIRDAAPDDLKPFAGVHSLQDFVPPQQAEKIPVLLDIKKFVLKAHNKDLIKAEDWKSLEPFLPPDDVKAFSLSELPVGLARAFTESDGTRGRIVYISPIDPESIDDARYLFRWADAYRETTLDDGSKIVGSGRAVIYADMWSAVLSDIPPAVTCSLLATMLVVLLAFRAGRPALAVVGSLLLGVAWMAGCLVLLEVRLNFLNFIALPITFGIGVDYAVNIVQRYVREGTGGALLALRETGGAVVLCSMTTILGYFALVGSMNFAVRSLGIAAVIGEFCCLFAAVLVLPAALWILDAKRRPGSASFLSMKPDGRGSPDA